MAEVPARQWRLAGTARSSTGGQAMQPRGKRSHHAVTVSALALTLAAGTAGIVTEAEARVTRVEIVSQEPAFGGLSFGSVGPYTKIFARAYGELDPSNARNALITDINLAPRNAAGNVEYSVDLHIVRPVNLGQGSRRMFYEVVNRGNKDLDAFNGEGSNNPATAADAGSGLLMRLGYSMVWSGWEDEGLVAPGNNRVLARLPIARNPDASPVVERTMNEVIFDNATGMNLNLPYAAATLDKSQAKMLIHNHTSFVGGPLVDRVEVPASVWSYNNERQVRIDRGNTFLAPYDQGAAYEFVYPAKDPQVLGIGLAATRDVVSFLRRDVSDMNPLRGGVDYALAYGQSQSGRYLKGFVYWGFNEDEDGRQVFEGILPKISGAHAIELNERFGDTNATGRSYQRHLSAKQEFPFTYGVRFDPISGLTDGTFARCQSTNTCPKVAHMDSGNEAYLKPTALVTTDGQGNDIVLPSNVRVYYVGSTQHGPAATASSTNTCQQLSNPNQHSPILRSLFVHLDAWATRNVSPPPSRYARVSDGTLVASLPQAVQGFPVIPGVTYTGWYNPVDLLDQSDLPPTPVPGKSYAVLVPKADADGNEIAGIRTVTTQVPLGTYTGWALRRAPFAANEDCALTGQFIPFRATQAERLAVGDPRLSLQERYPNHGAYVSKVARAANDLVRQRYLLAEDALRFIQQAAQSDIGK
jgi:hypothetical protein